ncbi:MAG: Txe/YoeB family addiction module toxin [Candidatus Kapabacteria bacterium]|nr:Txe/YoeB family addiction module toxin [Candidatus Kapabacteria bacterium]
MRILSFHQNAFFEYLEWNEIDLSKYNKINTLLKDILRHPFTGIGKPAPLKYKNNKYWSRRITDEHRIVYQVLDEMILIISCKGHYK